MGFLSALRNAWRGTAPDAPTTGPVSMQPGLSPFGKVAVRASVSFNTAMTVSAVYAAIRLTAETVACLPLTMYRLGADGTRTLERDHQLSKLLRHRPNLHQTRVEFWEQVVLNLCASGNAYVRLGKIGKEIKALTPINSASVTPELLENGLLRYEVTNQHGDTYQLNHDEVWHIRLFGNGLVGLSPLSLAAQTIRVALAAGDKTDSIMSNGAKPTGILSMPTWPTKEQRDILRQEMAGLVTGQSPEIPVFGPGMEFERISLTPADVELLATRRFSLEEIARIFGVPSVLINDTSASTVWGSGIQSLIEGYYKFNLRPYLERIECSLIVNLLPPEDWDNYEFEFNADSLLRASTQVRIESNSKQIQSGQATPNEIRIAEGRQPVAGGDELLVPANIIPVQNIGKPVAPIAVTDQTEVTQP